MENQNLQPTNQVKKPKISKGMWIIIGFFVVYLVFNLIMVSKNKDERLCIYEIPASVEWKMENNKSLIERDISLWKYEVAVREYGLTYVGEGMDSTLSNFTKLEVSYCNLSNRRGIEIPFKKRNLS